MSFIESLRRFLNPKKFLYALLALAIGLGIGYFVGRQSSADLIKSLKDSLAPVSEQGVSYALVHPLLAYRTPEATTLGEYTELNNSMQDIVNAATDNGSAARVSVYFRDLNASQWLGINEKYNYYPASLLKVPAMIAYYKQAESDPSTLYQTLSYDPSVMPADPFDATSTLTVGQSYSITQLISKMIVNSDNGATFTLLDRVDPDFLNSVYIALGVPNPGDNSANYQISTRTYAFFFRVLYNATYLSAAYSEKALELLSKTTYTNGLVAGVPPGTVVAHKYGEHVLAQGDVATGVELSDCGIVYYPEHPYVLCVMTSATGVSAAESIIAKISRAAYSAVQQQYATVMTDQ